MITGAFYYNSKLAERLLLVSYLIVGLKGLVHSDGNYSSMYNKGVVANKLALKLSQ